MSTHTREQPITALDLAKSRMASQRVEAALWQALAGRNVRANTPAVTVLMALVQVRRTPPAWCDASAWEAMCDTFARWARAFGNLRLFDELGRKREAEEHQSS